MTTFLGFINFVLFIILIVGLIKPTLILKNSKKNSRLKIFGLWFASTIIIGIIGIALISDSEIAELDIETAEKYITEGKYDDALSSLKDIKSENSLFEKSENLKIKIDSLQTAEKLVLEKEEKEQIKESLKRELESLKDGIDFSNYRGSVESIQIELILFGAWANSINDGELSEDSETKKLALLLKKKVKKYQISEFPRLRKDYAKVVANKMWENDIEVYSSGTGNRYINFAGGIFAANKNKKDFQTELQEILTLLRFKQSRYRWYKGEDEYTYWTNYEGKDSDLVTFE